MWVIVVSDSLQDHRDDRLSQIIDNHNVPQKYLTQLIPNRFNYTSGILYAKVFAKRKSAEFLIQRFITEDNKSFKSPFYYLKDNHLGIQKVSRDDWNKLIDFKISTEKSRHSRKISRLEKERLRFKDGI